MAGGFSKFTTMSLVCLLTLAPLRAESQAATEVRDSLRGITFYSLQISTDSMTSLQTQGSLFAQSDLMTLGFSALFFDESDTVEEYVLWLRHDGPRRWFTSDLEQPLTLRLDDVRWQSAPLHISRPAGRDGSGPLVEKLEFVVTADEFQALLNADAVTIELVTVLGTVVKALSESERLALRGFETRVKSRHIETQSASPK